VNLCFCIFIVITNAKAITIAIAVTVTLTLVATTGRYVRPQRAPLTQAEQDREDVGTEKLTKLSKTLELLLRLNETS
jgi:hypothetical protein